MSEVPGYQVGYQTKAAERNMGSARVQSDVSSKPVRNRPLPGEVCPCGHVALFIVKLGCHMAAIALI